LDLTKFTRLGVTFVETTSFFNDHIFISALLRPLKSIAIFLEGLRRSLKRIIGEGGEGGEGLHRVLGWSRSVENLFDVSGLWQGWFKTAKEYGENLQGVSISLKM
jgi:hypothetical protein